MSMVGGYGAGRLRLGGSSDDNNVPFGVFAVVRILLLSSCVAESART